MKVAVYGSLRQTMGNHSLMNGAEFVGTAKLMDDATLFSFGGFPVVSFAVAKSEPITVEIYDVTEPQQMRRLDALEGYPDWYNRTERQFQLEDGSTVTAWIYHQDKDFSDKLPVVETGDWVPYRNAVGRGF